MMEIHVVMINSKDRAMVVAHINNLPWLSGQEVMELSWHATVLVTKQTD